MIIKIPHFFDQQPTIPMQSANICAQCAVASVLEAYGKTSGYQNPTHLINTLCTNWPPDNFGGMLGTSASQIIRALNAHGLSAIQIALEPWYPGGFINPTNQILWHPHREKVEKHVKSGNLAICLVKCTKVGGTQWGLHWCVLASVDTMNARLCNAFNSADQYIELSMPLKSFHEAWECDGLEGLIPGLRFHAVLIS